MKPFPLLFAITSVFLPALATAQIRGATEVELERKANEERINRLTAQVETLSEAHQLISKRLDALEQNLASVKRDVDKLQEAFATPTTTYATTAQLRSVIEMLQEMERKREADKKLILDSIKDLAKVPLMSPVPGTPLAGNPENKATEEYRAEKGDSLIRIVAKWNARFEKQGLSRITLEQLKAANPNLKSDQIQEGQALRIPIPPKR